MAVAANHLYCASCGKEAQWLSMSSLCEKCQKKRGAKQVRKFDTRTGKLKVKEQQKEAVA